MQDEKVVLVPVNIIQATVNYLTTKPYAEVYQLVAAYIQATQVKPEEKKEEEKPKEK